MMSNIADDAKKRYAQTATRINQEKLKNGEYSRFLLQGKSEDMAIIEAAIAQAGGSRVQALKKICQAWLDMQAA